MKRIPAAGIAGLVALREAASTEYNQVIGLVRAAVQAHYDASKPANQTYAWFDVEAIYAYLQSIPPIRNRVPEPRPPLDVVAGK